MKNTTKSFWQYLAAGLLMVSLIACGGKPMEVKGSVTFKGKPVKSGTISFTPADSKGPSLGTRIKDGKYSISNEVDNAAGKKYVHITCVYETGQKVPVGPPEPPGKMVDQIKMLAFGENKELTCELLSGQVNEENFDLKSP